MDNVITHRLRETLEGSLMQNNPNANVEMSERMVSLGTGAFITLKGITNIFSHPMLALSELAIGGTLLYRGVTGYCPVKGMVENQRMHYSGEPMPVTSSTSAMGATGAAATGSTGSTDMNSF